MSELSISWARVTLRTLDLNCGFQRAWLAPPVSVRAGITAKQFQSTETINTKLKGKVKREEMFTGN